MYDLNYVVDLRRRMVADLEHEIQFGATLDSAKAEVLRRTRLAINVDARRAVLRDFAALQMEALSRRTRKAARTFDLYPEFRQRRRLPGILERLRSLLLSGPC
jgi:hypothetical protein